MAKAHRGLPSNFSLDIPEEDRPVAIGDFLDEAPLPMQQARPAVEPVSAPVQHFKPEIVPHRPAARPVPPRPVHQVAPRAPVVRCQLNLTPKSKAMLEELVEHVQTYSPEYKTTVSEVLQGIIGIVHASIDELELSHLPLRGAWGSVTARNFPNALGEAFERAIVQTTKRRVGD